MTPKPRKPSKVSVRAVKAWAVTSQRGTIFTPAVYGMALSVFPSKNLAVQFLQEHVHPGHFPEIVEATITYQRPVAKRKNT